jgi:hypothetical protein
MSSCFGGCCEEAGGEAGGSAALGGSLEPVAAGGELVFGFRPPVAADLDEPPDVFAFFS